MGNKSKPREEWVSAIVHNDGSGVGLEYNFETETVSFPNAEPGTVKYERSYRREGKPDKVTVSVPAAGASGFDSLTALRQYDHAVAIDTNYREIGGKTCAVCWAYMVPGGFAAHKGDIPFRPLAAYAILGVAPGINPEMIGWHLILSRHVVTAHRAAHGRLAVIVDSEFGDGVHKAINARERGYYGEHMLPAYATLLYAFDKEADTLPGMMVRFCHNHAKHALSAIDWSAISQEALMPGDGNFIGFGPIGITMARNVG